MSLWGGRFSDLTEWMAIAVHTLLTRPVPPPPPIPDEDLRIVSDPAFVQALLDEEERARAQVEAEQRAEQDRRNALAHAAWERQHEEAIQARRQALLDKKAEALMRGEVYEEPKPERDDRSYLPHHHSPVFGTGAIAHASYYGGGGVHHHLHHH